MFGWVGLVSIATSWERGGFLFCGLGNLASESQIIHDLNSTAIETLERVLTRGISDGVFRSDIDALDVHMMISSYSVFHVANRYTFRTLFNRDLLDDSRHDHYRHLAGDLIVAVMTDLP